MSIHARCRHYTKHISIPRTIIWMWNEGITFTLPEDCEKSHFSHILSKGKHFSLNFRLAKRNRIWMHWVVPLTKATSSVTLKISQVLRLWVCVCVSYCMFLSMGKYLIAYAVLQISGKLLNWHIWHRVKRWKLSSGLTASSYTVHSGRVWANYMSFWTISWRHYWNWESLSSPGNKATWWFYGLYTPLTVYWKSFFSLDRNFSSNFDCLKKKCSYWVSA